MNDQNHDQEMLRLIEFLAVVLGGGVQIKPVRLTNEPTAFYTVPLVVDRSTEQNYRANVAALVQYARKCGLFRQ